MIENSLLNGCSTRSKNHIYALKKPKRNASFDSERRGSVTSELSGLPGSEGCGASADDVPRETEYNKPLRDNAPQGFDIFWKER